MAILVVQATTACNSACPYCYRRHLGNGSSMDHATLTLLFERIGEFLGDNPSEPVEIQWHGGEPLLAGAPFFEKALDLQRRLAPDAARRIRHTMQSNLTLLDHRNLALLQALGIRDIGTSYDPAPGGRYSDNPAHHAQYAAAFISAVSMLEASGMDWGVIYVVTKNSLRQPAAPFYFLTNLNTRGKLFFNPVFSISKCSSAGYMITPDEFLWFLGNVLRVWWPHRNRFPLVEPFHSAAASLEGTDGADGGASACPPLLITPHGSVHLAGRPDESEKTPLGTLTNDSLAGLLETADRFNRETIAQRMRKNGCDACDIYRQCRCGRLLACFSQEDTFAGKSGWCETRRAFINDHLKPVIDGKRLS